MGFGKISTTQYPPDIFLTLYDTNLSGKIEVEEIKSKPIGITWETLNEQCDLVDWVSVANEAHASDDGLSNVAGFLPGSLISISEFNRQFILTDSLGYLDFLHERDNAYESVLIHRLAIGFLMFASLSPEESSRIISEIKVRGDTYGDYLKMAFSGPMKFSTLNQASLVASMVRARHLDSIFELAVETHEDLSSVTQDLVTNSPQILSFGEIHPYVIKEIGGGLASADELFFAGNFNLLCDMGYTHFVTEYIPAEVPQNEIEIFLNTGVITADTTPVWYADSTLGDVQIKNEYDRQDLEPLRQAILKARSNGHDIVVYGSLPSRSEVVRVMNASNSRERKKYLDGAAELVAKNTYNQVKLILKNNSAAKIITYNGSLHNQPSAGALYWPKKQMNIQSVDLHIPESDASISQGYWDGDVVKQLNETEFLEGQTDLLPETVYAVQIADPTEFRVFQTPDNTKHVVFPVSYVGSADK